MANGDITYIRKLGSTLLPGGGQSTTGGKKQNKVLVWGKISCTYVSTGVALDGLSNPLQALGVETLDFIDFQVKDTGAGTMADDAIYLVRLDRVDNKIFVIEDVGAADAAAPTDGDILDLRYWALGDAPAADLT